MSHVAAKRRALGQCDPFRQRKQQEQGQAPASDRQTVLGGLNIEQPRTMPGYGNPSEDNQFKPIYGEIDSTAGETVSSITVTRSFRPSEWPLRRSDNVPGFGSVTTTASSVDACAKSR